MKVVILCGGLGSRLAEETKLIPKPMIKDKLLLIHSTFCHHSPMRTLPILLVSLLLLIFQSAQALSLPPCPGSYDKKAWTDCIGSYTWPSGSKYHGQWQTGIKHGEGTHTFTDGSKYEGQWENGKQHGRGIYSFTDGSKYESS